MLLNIKYNIKCYYIYIHNRINKDHFIKITLFIDCLLKKINIQISMLGK